MNKTIPLYLLFSCFLLSSLNGGIDHSKIDNIEGHTALDSVCIRCNNLYIGTEPNGTITLPIDAFGTVAFFCESETPIPIINIGFDPDMEIDSMTWGCIEPYNDPLVENIFFDIYLETEFGLEVCEAIIFLTTPTESESCRPFISTWETKTPKDTIELPVEVLNYDYNYVVDWGDGINNNKDFHVYSEPGQYQITINGTFPKIYFNDSDDREKIISIDQWGDQPWKSFENSFSGCSNLEILAEDDPSISNPNFSMANAFKDCESLDYSFENWDVSNVTDMSGMLDGTNLSVENYDNLLIAWSQQDLQENVSFSSLTNKYCDGRFARDYIMSEFGWTINDDGLSDGCIVGTEDLSINSLIYPNPTSNIVSLHQDFEGSAYRLYNSSSRLEEEGILADQLNLEEYKTGVYFLKVINGEGMIRVIKVLKL